VQPVGERLQGVPQHRPPLLPGRLAGVESAAALLLPAADPVDARPGAGLHELHRLPGRRAGQDGAEALHAGVGPPAHGAHERAQGHVGEALVVPEGLAVGGEADHRAGLVGVGHAPHPGPGVLGQGPERHVVGEGPVVDEDRDGSAARQLHPAWEAALGDGLHLVRSQHREADPLFGQDLQGLGVHGGLGEPHPLGLPAESAPEVGDPPPDLGHLVPSRGQGEDHVMIGTGQGVSVSGALQGAGVGLQEGPVGLGLLSSEPGEEGGAGVPADPVQRVHHARDPAPRIQDPGAHHRPVALVVDPLVPVVPGSGGGLPGHPARPGVLPGRLVEVAVDDQGASGHGERLRPGARRALPVALPASRRLRGALRTCRGRGIVLMVGAGRGSSASAASKVSLRRPRT